MSDAEPSPDPKPAPRLGSYLLNHQLGSGGMSNVFYAVHEESGSVVALKVLPRTLAKNPTLLQRFLREAKSAEALDHPNIVAIYDRGFDQGRHYLVLEYVEGRDLHDRVRMNGPLGTDEVVRFIREVAEGLRYAAGRGMIHRDVKPANLLMTPNGHAKIIDLGLALQVEDEDERVTRDGTTVGTVDYMAPEQARDSRQTSERSDIYSLGCTFYYLLTGSQPYAGGGLADKLARHYKAPIPDPRAVRPDVSEALSLVIRRMMEKKPDLRYADYTQLIAALDALSGPPIASAGPTVTLDAIIDDEDDDDGEIGLAPIESAGPTPRGSSVERPPEAFDLLTAEIVDDDDEDDAPPPSHASKEVPNRREPSRPAEVSLAELAAMDADDAPPRRPVRRPAAPAAPTPPLPGPSMDDLLDEEDEPTEGMATGVRGGGPELSLKTWIAAGVMVGLAIAVVGFGVSMLISFAKPLPPEVVTNRDPEPLPEDAPVIASTTPRPNSPSPVRPTPIPKSSVLPTVLPIVRPAEPASSEVVLKEVDYPKEWESRLGAPLSPTELPIPDRPRVILRRVPEAGDEAQVTSLAAAFGRSGDVEIADTGPFFEDDTSIAGKSRVIRARPGLRPILKVEFTSQQALKEREAKFVLGGTKVDRLVLEGIDLAVDVRDLPEHQTTLFLCQGADLTLRDCSITLLNVSERRSTRFSIFRVEEGIRPNRIVLERSTIRGPIRTLVEMVAARAEVVLDRSIVEGEAGPLIAIEPADRPARSLFFHRSLVATRGPLLEFPTRAVPLVVRSLGSTFARIEGAGASGLIHSKVAFSGDPKGALDWSGEDNGFVGWPAWLTSGSESAVRVTSLEGVRIAWPGSDGSSRETSAGWPATIAREDITPADFAGLAPDRRATLARIATPHPRLREVAFSAINRLATPELSATLIPPFVAPPPMPDAPPPMPAPVPAPVSAKAKTNSKPASNPNGPVLRTPPAANPNGPVPKAGPIANAPPPAPPAIDITFDVAAAPWSGDLGQFLAEKLVPGTFRATIRVRGGGVHLTSAARLPDGLSIAILGETGEGVKGPISTFIPKAGAVGRSMIELRGGDLALANLAFASDGVIRPKHWVRVEDGLLGIKHCRFRDPGGVVAEVGAVVSFVAAGSAPIAPRVGPFVAAIDRPTARLQNCLIWTGGDAISVELGRGAVDLENCLVISGGPAVSLLPRNVARAKFEADLVLERCTIADDRAGIQLGPWPGDPLGPDRPWLVSTRSCAFPRTQVGGAGALLVVDPDAMSRGALFWQSFFDAYDVARFVASSGPTPANPSPTDIKRGWIDFWGPQHARSVRGPDPRNPSDHALRFKDKARPRPGRVTPNSLELDPKGQKDLGVHFPDLPPAPKN